MKVDLDVRVYEFMVCVNVVIEACLVDRGIGDIV